MIRLLLAGLVAATVLILPHTPKGQTQEPGTGDCGPRPAMAQFVAQTMGDPSGVTRTASMENGVLVEEFTNDRRWLKIATRREGITCILGSGWRT